MDPQGYIDSQFERSVFELQAWCRQPSVSTTNQGMSEMAGLVRDKLSEIGFATQLIAIEGGYPVVYAERRGASEKTLLFYNHYDVQPPEPLEAWQTDPFGAEIREGRLFARGVADDKGCLLSRIQAVEAVLETRGELPVSIKFLVEGEEEISSPHLHSFVETHKELLAADWCVWEYAAKNELGQPTMTLGNKGMCYLQLTATGAKDDKHSMFAPVVPNPAWRLAWALASMKNEQEEILVPGFYDDVEPLSGEELEVLDRIPVDENLLKRQFGLSYFLLDLKGNEFKKRLYGWPTCTICGLASGYQGAGKKTIVPSQATAKIDFRLVVHQHPDDILAKVSQHLSARGFSDVQVEMLGGTMPAKTPVTDPFVHTVVCAARHAYGQEIVILPTSAGSGPRDAFASWTQMPIVGLGVGHVGTNLHGPNENIVLQDYREGIWHIAALLEELAGSGI